MRPTNPFVEFRKEDIEQSISDRFEQQAQRYPQRLAVKTKTQSLTYDELNRMANRVAHAVLAHYDNGFEVVALLFKQGAAAIATSLGVLKAGKAYASVDYLLPRARSIKILEDIQAPVILTDNEHLSLAEELASNSTKVLNVEELDAKLSEDNPGSSVSSDQIAFVHYTSGSTGDPKGVVASHRNELYNIMKNSNALRISPVDRVSLLRSNNVGATRDTLLALLNGAALISLDLKDKDLANLGGWLIEEKVTVFTCVTTVFRQAVTTLGGQDKLPKLRLIHVGGEPINRNDIELYKRHFADHCTFVVRYSISETPAVTYYFVNKQTKIDGERIPVGYPLEGNEVLLLDDDGKKVTANRVGEIAVRSPYLALGYWRQPELTQSKFLPDPNGGKARIYLTGDLGYMLPDGCLVHVGRKDFQTKIRGHRVEVSEVEMALLDVAEIRHAVVVPRGDSPDGKRLVAYIVPQKGCALTTSGLHNLLKKKLPNYMLPSSFVMLESLPVTASGKVDRRALPPPTKTRPALSPAFIAPRTPVESGVAKIWSETLCVDEIGIHDNFFELGGDSLLAMQLIANVSKAFRVNPSPRDLFEAPTVAGIAETIEKGLREVDRSKPLPFGRVPRKRRGLLSFAQEQLWLLEHLLPGNHLFTYASAYRLGGRLDVGILKQSLGKLITRHQALRTVFGERDEQPVQIITDPSDIELPLVDLSDLPFARREQTLARLAAEDDDGHLDLRHGPVIRTKLFRLTDEEHVLMVRMHQIISDRESIRVFWSELKLIYDALIRGRPPSLPELPIRFVDFVYWQRRALDSRFMKEQLAYWEKQLAGRFPKLVIGRRSKREELSFRTTRLPIEVDDNLVAALKGLSRKERCTPFMVLLAALEITLHLYTGQNDIRVGTLVANRTRTETERLIGHLINTVILRGRLSRNLTLRQLLARVRESTLAAYAHQSLPFEHLVRALERERKIDRASLFQVMFVYHNLALETSDATSLSFRPDYRIGRRDDDPGMTPTTCDLILLLKETSNGLLGSFTFKSDAIHSRIIDDMRQTFIKVVENMITQPGSTIREVCAKVRG